MTAVLGSEPFVTKTLILFFALIYAAGCGGGGGGAGAYSGGSGSTGFAGGYYRYQKKARLFLLPYNNPYFEIHSLKCIISWFCANDTHDKGAFLPLSS